MLGGIIPILITPFDEYGQIDEFSLRRLVRFELDQSPQGLGIGGFASEAYKLTESERLRCAEIVTDEMQNELPLVIGIAPGSLEAALETAALLEPLHPAALMTLPPATMAYPPETLIEFYVSFAAYAPAPVMVQQAPQVPAYAHTQLTTAQLAEIAQRAPGVCAFKIEGKGSAERIADLKAEVSSDVRLFGGVGGITLTAELLAGAAGLLPGVAFNDYFHAAYARWSEGDAAATVRLLEEVQPLVQAVSGHGHEFSLHARKMLLAEAGIIATNYVRWPTLPPESAWLEAVRSAARQLDLALNRYR
jgi:4-hydroxy-tetrahydrodipicolinate synthase